MGKLLHTVVPVDEAARKALLALLPAKLQAVYARALQAQDPALLVVVGERTEVNDLNKQILEEGGLPFVEEREPWLPEPLNFQLPKELGSLRREELYEG